MSIQVGERLPEVPLQRIREGVEIVDTRTLFDGKKVALFAVPAIVALAVWDPASVPIVQTARTMPSVSEVVDTARTTPVVADQVMSCPATRLPY